MSFMMKPLNYDEWGAINSVSVKKERIHVGEEAVSAYLIAELKKALENGKKRILVDGYIGAKFEKVIRPLSVSLGLPVISMVDLYKSQEEIDEMTKDNLPLNYDEDPVLLFGRIFKGQIEDLIDDNKARNVPEVCLVFGNGAACDYLYNEDSVVVYIDVIPKNTAVRARENQFKNIGDKKVRPFSALMRRNYYVDFEVVVKARKRMLANQTIDYYVGDNNPFVAMDISTLKEITDQLSQKPFRCKPVYLEGIWGGEYLRKVRRLPMDLSDNIAWVFEFIPMEVSIVADCEGIYVDIPFCTFMQTNGKDIIGEKAYKEFDGYFPIRFNYDDSYHSDGNMSIQVHPDEDFIIENYDEFGRQDEAYYVVATGHGAKTYCGFKEGVSAQEFIELAKQSEKDGSTIDYKKYINAIDSKIGTQVMLPAGTIHSSGQNQFILELGSLTIGSYTYKMYDYNRRDKNGNLRPIHTVNGEKVLRTERTTSWVNENICIEPIEVEKTDQYEEYIVGKTDLAYYQTARVELKTNGVYEHSNDGKFTVLTLVDGEKVKIYSKSNPNFVYHQNYLDIVVVPHSIDDYVIENEGYQPAVIHKTYLRPGYSRYKNR